MTREIKRKLNAVLKEITGSGEQVTFVVHGWRTTKAGTREQYELELQACRHAVRLLLAELRKMHVRDRDRLAREQVRIEREVRELTQEQA